MAVDAVGLARRGGGGLVTALRSLVEHHDVTWIASAMSEEDRVVMGLRHTSLPMEGVQFHPESVLTPLGARMAENFLS